MSNKPRGARGTRGIRNRQNDSFSIFHLSSSIFHLLSRSDRRNASSATNKNDKWKMEIEMVNRKHYSTMAKENRLTPFPVLPVTPVVMSVFLRVLLSWLLDSVSSSFAPAHPNFLLRLLRPRSAPRESSASSTALARRCSP